MIKELSNRENQIVAEVSRGYSVKEIATRLFLSPYTVDTHIKKAKRKTGARSLAGLTREFVLSLDNPKQFYKAMIVTLFLGIQIMVCLSDCNIDLRKPSRTRISKVHRRKGD